MDKMKAAEAAFKDSVPRVGGRKRIRNSVGHRARRVVRNPALPRLRGLSTVAPDCSAWVDYAAAQKRLQAHPGAENHLIALIVIVFIYRKYRILRFHLLIEAFYHFPVDSAVA